MREAFNELLDEHLPPEKLVRCIVEGLDATLVKFFSRERDAIETVVLPDQRVRLLFLVLALKLKGWDLLPAGRAFMMWFEPFVGRTSEIGDAHER